MSKNLELCCPECGKQIIDTRDVVQPYSDFDDYAGYRCSGCNKTFTDGEVAKMMEPPSA